MKKLIVFLGLCALSLNAQAVLLTNLLNGESIMAGDKLFDNWSIHFADKSDFTQVNTDNIEVTALDDGGLEPGPGLRFDILNNEFLVEGDGFYAYLDFMFGFRVSLDPQPYIKDNSLYLTGAELINENELASVFIEENIYADETLNDWYGIKDVELSYVYGDEFSKLEDSADFAPSSSIYVTKNILLEAVNIDEAANLFSFEQRFSQVILPVPEPAVFWLFAAGLVTLAARKKRQSLGKA